MDNKKDEQEKNKKVLISRLYKNYSTGRLDSFKDQSSIIQQHESTLDLNKSKSVADKFGPLNMSKGLIPKIMNSKRLQPIDTGRYAHPIQIENGKFLLSMTSKHIGQQSLVLSQSNASILKDQLSVLPPIDPQTSKARLTLDKINRKQLSQYGKSMAGLEISTSKPESLRVEPQQVSQAVYQQAGLMQQQQPGQEQESLQKSQLLQQSFDQKQAKKNLLAEKKQLLQIKKSMPKFGKKKRPNKDEPGDAKEPILKPMDFINLIRTDPEMRDEFCYLNRQSHPYDYKIVEFNSRNPNEYMTISARGITHFYKDEVYFMTIEEWEREAKMFHQLLQIDFFKQYKKWKNFSLWKKLMRKNEMRKNSNKLSQQLFIVDKTLAQAVLRIRELTQKMSQKISYIDLQENQAHPIEEFVHNQEKYRVVNTEVKLEVVDNSIRDLVIDNCKKSLVSFKEDNRIPVKSEQGQQAGDEQPPLLVGDETGKDMPFTQEATIRTHIKRLRKFVKLIDYIVIDAKVQMFNNCTEALCQQVEDRNIQLKRKDMGYFVSMQSWLIINASMTSYKLHFVPDRMQFIRVFEDIISKSMQRICSKHKPLIKCDELWEYIKNKDKREQEAEEDTNIDMSVLILNNETYRQLYEEFKKSLNASFDNVEAYAKFLNKFIQVYQENTNLDLGFFEKCENEQFKISLRKYQQQDQDLQAIEPSQELGLILFDNKELKDKIKNCASVCLHDLHQLIPQLLKKRSKDFYDMVSQTNSKIAFLPTTVESFVKLNETVNEIQYKLEDITSQKAEIEELDLIMEEFKIKCPEEIKQQAKDAYNALKTLRTKLEEASSSSDSNFQKFRRELERMEPSINLSIKEMQDQLADVPYASREANVEQTIQKILAISSKLTDVQKQAKRMQEWELALQVEINQFEKLEQFASEFRMIEKLWLSRKEWSEQYKSWSETHFQQIDIDDMSNKMEKLGKIANLCAKELETNELSRDFKVQVESYKKIVGLLSSLKDPALSEVPWEEIRQLLAAPEQAQVPFHDINDKMYTVKWIEDHHIVAKADQIAEIALKAAKEVELVNLLNNVESFWNSSTIAVTNYKERSDVFILANNEELISKLDDTLLTVNNILASRFVERIRERVEKQLQLFRYLQELLDEWMLHQRNWLYLEPILSSPYAVKNMQREVKIFTIADGSWKKIMKQANDFPYAKRWASDCKQKQYLSTLQNNNHQFDIIQKALDELLEKKREVFQRFFFLSNDEILEILSQAKNIQSVVPHLRKCFENIVKLEFDSHDYAQAMISAEKERVPLRNYIAKGEEVEVWFKDLEDCMRYSLKYIFRQAFIKYESEDTQRKDWILQYPSQIVLTLDSVYWTKITEENYLGPDADGDLNDWLEGLVGQLAELTDLITRDQTELQRRTLTALAVQDVHYRDIIDELAKEGIESTSDFKWQQQLKLYYEDEINCKQVQTQISYGYEYLGASSRLVITPLTDRCWITITGALGIKLGASPVGPAGTGKTESCKDLAKNLGKYCIVFNCSDQINVKMMEKLFMGCCQTASWVCLDEFNRIDIEVLSVIAQQVLTIREGMLEKRTTFPFFGKMVTLAHQADMSIFTTMNPGYAGRTELPDNLKVLFRPVSMMVPDYSLIAEIMLFAEGFSDAKNLSQKMTKLYKLSSEQLSQQDHYDFGMRAVKSVLVMAGALKRAEPSVGEDLVLIRAMRDSNVPKFLSQDIPLFNAIVQDLFPGLNIPPIANKQLEAVILDKIKLGNLIPEPNFIEKILQLHETLKVRFGVMIVGPSMGGKSQCLNILKNSYVQLNEDILSDNNNVNNHPEFQNILSTFLNPKSIKMEELYGDYDPLSQSWTDGLASKILREYSNMESKDKKWVIFDGPVDSLWIENMNSVLDDTMTLCLANGERIKLKPQMKMLFEVLDLAVASPATVSRCGMVYLDEDVVGYRSIVNSYFKVHMESLILKPEFREQMQNQIVNMFKKLIQPIKKNFKMPILTADSNLVVSVCNIIRAILQTDAGTAHLDVPETAKKAIERLTLWAFAWGTGAPITSQNKEKYEKALVDIAPSSIYPKGSIFSYFFSFSVPEGEFVPWTSIVPEFNYLPEMSYFDMVVPTQETTCYSWFIDKFVRQLNPIYLTGMTGTGKTIIVQNTLNKLREDGVTSNLTMNFSAKTTSYSTQLLIEQKLQTQRKNKRVILMPPPGKKLAIFVDDINMPAVEQFGAQPPIELLRQYVDYKGVYDRKNLFWKDIDSAVLVVASAPPGGGRSALTTRFTRHFNIMNMPDSSEECLTQIFSQILFNFFKKKNFKKELVDIAENKSVVFATLGVYVAIQQQLLPTPQKSHYIFNLRDVSKVFQGILLAKPLQISTAASLAKLWMHETMRVFYDRLINEQDKAWFVDELLKQQFLYFKMDWKKEEILFGETPLLFASFLKRGLEVEHRVYEEIKDIKALQKIINDYMMEETKLNLVLFKDAIEHLCRLSRVLSFQRGHAMLVGVGGSGKKSLITLSTALACANMDTIEPKKAYGKKEFKEDLLRMMKKSSIQNKPVVFMFVDTQILQESFLEDVNNLLNSGEIPNFLTKEEMEQINSELANDARLLKIQDPYQLFVDRVKNQLHVVLAFSPVGQQLRVRMRMFPSIVNCCTIDWLAPWPDEALQTVAKMYLDELDFESMTNEIRASLSTCCMYVHQQVDIMIEKFYKNLKRKVYITPKSYIDLLQAYKQLLKKKYDQIFTNKNKLSNGLSKLKQANEIIAELKQKLTDLQPILQKKTIEMDELIKKLEVDSYEANKKKAIVEEEESVVNEKAQQIKELKDEADNVLKDAMPILQQAIDALNILDRKVISEIKSNNNPHDQVRFSLECVNVLFEEKQDWDSIKKVLADPSLVSRMKNLDVYGIKEKTEVTIKKKLKSNPDFVPSKVEKVSVAAKAICEWVTAVSSFTDVNKMINKKKETVNKLDAEYQSANAQLKAKQDELKIVVDKVELLERQYQESKTEKERIDGEITKTSERLVRAQVLTVGLADEQERWKVTVELLTDDLKLIIGNVFVAASSITYYGPFTGQYRDELVALWVQKCAEMQIPCSENYSIQRVLSDPVTIRHWNVKGLPSDNVSLNNGILVYNCISVPLMIDPQMQAIKWIKNLEAQKQIRVIKMNSPDLPKVLEAYVRMGQPLLICDMEETFEAILDPLLQKQFTQLKRRKLIRIGDSDVDYDENFQLFIQTKVPNPDFLPDIFIRSTVINFTVTQLGLEEQLLADVVMIEMPQVENEKNQLILQIADSNAVLKKNEDKILELLNNSKGMILDDVDLIENLKLSKETAEIVKQKIQEGEEKQVEIDKARGQYAIIAERGSLLYFAIADLALIDPMYQYSLSYFKRLFCLIIQTTAKSQETEERINQLLSQITLILYQNICRGLFNDHKKLFSFMVASAIFLQNHSIQKPEWNVFVRGTAFSNSAIHPQPESSNLTQKQWEEICKVVSASPVFEELPKSAAKNQKAWEDWISSSEPYLQELPAPYKGENALSQFQLLLLVRLLRPELTQQAMNNYVQKTLGTKYTSSQASTMEEVFGDTDYKTPLIFVLSKGADPLINLLNFAKEKKITQEKLAIISLGQGQGPIAERAIDNGIKTGGWVILQNCHLGKSFMPRLEQLILELYEASGEHNESYRLILTSMPCSYFPVSILQNGVKLTNEPPKGIKSNIQKSYNELSLDRFNGCHSNVPAWQKLLFSLSFFHAVIQERRKFGPLGWNILYEFNESDLDTGITILKNMLEQHEDIPWDALRYVIGEITYGGRVTDDIDRRLLRTILNIYINQDVLTADYSYSMSHQYVSPPEGDLQYYRGLIADYPEYEQPEVFGMHNNANISYMLKESKQALDTILSIQPRDIGGSSSEGQKSTDEFVEELCSNFEQKLPQLIKQEQPQSLNKKRATVTDINIQQSKVTINQMVVCMEQECARFNELLVVIQKSLVSLKKALKGESIMSADLDRMYLSLINNQVPDLWKDKSYPSLKSLSAWFEDMILRVEFFRSWMISQQQTDKPPKAFWLSAFFFPQGFLTSVLQNYARAKMIPIDVLGFSFKFFNIVNVDDIVTTSLNGVYIYGLFMEGCRFDNNYTGLDESQPGVIYTQVPVIEFIPTENYQPSPDQYSMPLYKTTQRAGTLSTTGHSTNFIQFIEVPTKKQPSHWILRGAAFTCMKD